MVDIKIFWKITVSYENWRSSVLTDNVEYSFGSREFLMLIYFNLVVPKSKIL